MHFWFCNFFFIWCVQIYVDGHLHQQANSPHIAKTIVKNVDSRLYHGFSIQTVGSGGRCSDLVETSHNATVTGPRREVIEESPSGIKNNEVYSSSHKRLVRITGLNILML